MAKTDLYYGYYFQQYNQAMRTKKGQKTESNHSHRPSTISKSSTHSNRRAQKSNKQNLIQVTEPLDAHQTYSSKEFILSRQNLNSASKVPLKEIGGARNSSKPPKVQYGNYQETSQESFDRRLSLKYTGNYSQQLDYQKSQRLSMAPLRRQSLGQTIAPPQSLIDERESLSSMYQPSLLSNSDSRSKLTLKKEAIMTNLMHKLDHEEDLRSIIELKLRNGTNMSSISSKQLRDKKSTSYITDFTEEHQSHIAASKLEQCQNEIVYFKTVIREMSEKIVELTQDRKFKRKSVQRDSPSSKVDQSQVLSLLRRINMPCHKCEQKDTKTFATQVDQADMKPQQQQQPQAASSDFFDNLERTLKVLDGNK